MSPKRLRTDKGGVGRDDELRLRLRHSDDRVRSCYLIPQAVTLPASSDHKLSFYFGWMKWVVLGHGEGLMRDAVHIEGHTWDFHIEDKVVPVLITDLAKATEA